MKSFVLKIRTEIKQNLKDIFSYEITTIFDDVYLDQMIESLNTTNPNQSKKISEKITERFIEAVEILNKLKLIGFTDDYKIIVRDLLKNYNKNQVYQKIVEEIYYKSNINIDPALVSSIDIVTSSSTDIQPHLVIYNFLNTYILNEKSKMQELDLESIRLTWDLSGSRKSLELFIQSELENLLHVFLISNKNIKDFKNEYSNPTEIIQNRITRIQQLIPGQNYIKIRGDGNCFYRALYVSWLNSSFKSNIITQSKKQIEEYNSSFEKIHLFEDLQYAQNYSDSPFPDLQSYLNSLINIIADDLPQVNVEYLESIQPFQDQIFIRFLRLICALEFYKNVEQYIGFLFEVRDTNAYVMENILKIDIEADNLHLQILANALKINIQYINFTDPKLEIISSTSSSPIFGTLGTVFYRPGHYDLFL